MTNASSIPVFDSSDWHWRADDGRIYSSRKNALVYLYDSGYLAFVARHGGAATPWPRDAQGNQTTAALQAVVGPYGITIPFT